MVGADVAAAGSVWRCPVTGLPLETVDRDTAAARLGGVLAPPPRVGVAAVGATAQVALTRDGWAYPIVDGIPVLMAPERLYPRGDGPPADVTVDPYAEAYSEIEPYTRQCDISGHADVITDEGARLRYLSVVGRRTAPWPTPGVWLGGSDDVGAQHHALRHLAPVDDRSVLQIGGNGIHGLNMLAAGAASMVLVTPVLEELRWCRAVAEHAGLEDRLLVAAGLAEELPLPDASFDIVYSPSSLHHTVTRSSFPEISRVLAEGGRFASVDVHRSVLYDLGVRVFGKREANVYCRPLDPERLAPARALPQVQLSWHGAIFRYPLAVLARKQRHPSLRWHLRLAAVEDALTRRAQRLESLASMVTVTAQVPSQTKRKNEPKASPDLVGPVANSN